MKKVLQALYNGEIYPEEQYQPILEEYKALREKQYKNYSDFIKKIGSPLDKEFERILDEQSALLPLDFFQMFSDGFRLGVKMMIEVFEDTSHIKENAKPCNGN